MKNYHKIKNNFYIFFENYSKLVEAIAMLLILISWGLEWNGLKRLEHNTMTLHSSLDSIQRAYLSFGLSTTVRMEAAVNRYILEQHSDTDIKFLGDYAKSWESPDVRHEWFKRFSNELSTIQSRLMVLKSISKRSSLNIKNKINIIEAKTTSIQKELASKLNIDALDGKVLIKPDLNLMSGREAGLLDNKLNPINDEILKLVNETIENMQNRQNLYSNIFRNIFLIGSFLLITTKFFDWYNSHRKKAISHKT